MANPSQQLISSLGGVVPTWAAWDATKDGSTVAISGSVVNVGSASVCMLSATTALAFWSDNSTGFGTACVATISGDVVSWGTPAVVTGATVVSNNAIVALTSTQAIVTFFKSTGSSTNAFVINISGTTPSGGTIAKISSGTNVTLGTNGQNIDKISSTQAILAFQDNTLGGQVVVLTVAASVVTAGTALAFTGGTNVRQVAVSNISSSAALLFYGDASNLQKTTAQVISNSSSVLSTNTAAVVDASDTTAISICSVAQLSPTSFGVSYNDTTTVYAAALSISGTAVTAGSPVTIQSATHTYQNNSLCKGDSSSLMFTYIDGSSNLQGRVGSVSGTTITLQTVHQIAAAITAGPLTANLDTQHIFGFYADGSTVGNGKIISIV